MPAKVIKLVELKMMDGYLCPTNLITLSGAQNSDFITKFATFINKQMTNKSQVNYKWMTNYLKLLKRSNKQ